MGFRINTNVAAMRGQTTLNRVARETEESSAKLSSGTRITKAADDAAGLAISEKLKAEIRSSHQANRNANDGISLVQTAEGGLNESSSILTRMRELAIQASTDTLSDSDRVKTDLEYQQLKFELDRISKSTEFNGRKLLNGTGGRLDFQVGVGAHTSDDVISINSDQLNSGIENLGVSSVGISTKRTAQDSLEKIDAAINKVNAHRSQLGSIQNRLNNSSNNLMIYTENMSSANSRIRDVEYAEETANLAKTKILGAASTAVMAQANTSPKEALKII